MPLSNILKSWELVLAAVLMAVVGALLYVWQNEPVYETSAEVLVTPVDDTSFVGLPILTPSADPTRVAQTAVGLIQTASTADATAKALGGGFTREKSVSAVAVAPRGESNILAVTAHDADPQVATRIANTYVESALAERKRALAGPLDRRIQELSSQEQSLGKTDAANAGVTSQLTRLRFAREAGDPSLSASQPAVAPDSPSSPGALFVVAVAALVGLVIGCIAAMMLGPLWPPARRRG
jgi:capsular polysaccharide biosynthesis protein